MVEVAAQVRYILNGKINYSAQTTSTGGNMGWTRYAGAAAGDNTKGIIAGGNNAGGNYLCYVYIYSGDVTMSGSSLAGGIRSELGGVCSTPGGF